MPITREAVIWGYIYFLGRKPESEETIQAHMHTQDEQTFAETMLRSREFHLGNRYSHLIEMKVPPSLPQARQHVATSKIRIAIVGNCQVGPLSKCLQALSGSVAATPVEYTAKMYRKAAQGEMDADLAKLATGHDVLLVHPFEEIRQLLGKASALPGAKIHLIPKVEFSAFHPDLIYIESKDKIGRLRGPLIEYNSSLVFYGWQRGMKKSEILELFRDEVYSELGFYDFWTSAVEGLLREGSSIGFPLDSLLDSWKKKGCFMHSSNHPKLFVIADLAGAILNRLGIDTIPGATDYVADNFADGPVWPVYPEIGKRLGIDGNYLFKMHRADCPHDKPVLMFDLEGFVDTSLKTFSKYNKDDFVCRRNLDHYRRLEAPTMERGIRKPAATLPSETATSRRFYIPKRTPYDGLPDFHFWHKAIGGTVLREVDPVVSASLKLDRQTRIATAGSCFAQHISRNLRRHGFNYFVTEDAGGLPPEEASSLGYGLFSARYGNIYTACQLVQLLERAFGEFNTMEKAWLRPDGRFVDPFRPRVEPEGFKTSKAVEASREAHFACVREMFENLDVLVFTLGLTEAWRSVRDGAVFPLAPGVAGGVIDSGRYEFVNFQVSEVVADLEKFVQKLTKLNPGARIIFTVSPVPLAATYENRHVLVATTYSKSVLRVAAEALASGHANCFYFPSYEIITGNFNRSAYFNGDFRTVNAAGIDHVMRLFFAHYSSENISGEFNEALKLEFESMKEAVCDEEEIAEAASPNA